MCVWIQSGVHLHLLLFSLFLLLFLPYFLPPNVNVIVARTPSD